MKIGISARGIDFQSGGAKLYIEKFLEHLKELDSPHTFVVFHDLEQNKGKYQTENIQEVFIAPSPIFNKLNRNLGRFIWDQVQLPLTLNSYLDIEVMFFAKYEKPFFVSHPSVVAFLDLAYLLPGLNAYPWAPNLYKKLTIPYSARHSQAVITISKHTQRDVYQLISGIDTDKVHPVYLDAGYKENGKSDHRYVRDKYGIGETPYVFLSSSLSPRKNIIRALRAIALIKEEIPHKFVMTGGKSWKVKNIAEEVEKLNLQDKFLKIGFVDDEDMHSIFQEADVYFHPSLYEGFGLTLLEAMYAKTPVAYSHISSHPEVAGEAGLPFDPYDVQEMAAVLKRLCLDKHLQQELAEKGLENIKRFSWAKMTGEIVDILVQTATKHSKK
jgi:glycosyltransferase involved in cell wall biosynthesis